MSKYIKDFRTESNEKSIINIDLVCKDWNDRFFIQTWINEKQEEYTFFVKGKRKNRTLCNVAISKEQATEIVNRLNLVHVQSSLVRSGGTYRSESFIKSEIERLTNEKRLKEMELDDILKQLFQYERSI